MLCLHDILFYTVGSFIMQVLFVHMILSLLELTALFMRGTVWYR